MHIFVTGASGYIGGSVAVRLRDAGHAIRGLVRRADTAERLRMLGIEPVIGTLEDAALLTDAARRADAVVNAASSDHRGAADALVAALAGSGKVLLHTSGTSIVATDSRGEPDDRIFTEDTPVHPVPEKAARVALDRSIREAADMGVHSIVLCNSMIYGHGLGLHRDSVQVPRLVEFARNSGVARHIGRGENIWSNVHIADMAELYLLALTRAPAGSFYYVENGEASYREIAAAIATALSLRQPPQSLDPEEAFRLWGFERAAFSLGSNSRVSSARARRELGWAPRHASLTDWILRELAAPAA